MFWRQFVLLKPFLNSQRFNSLVQMTNKSEGVTLVYLGKGEQIMYKN